jgi:peptidoglycan biosynthesis protein MviN/MurJ (putative lipid II flippase)
MERMTTGAPPRPSAPGSPPSLIQTTTNTARSSAAVAASFLLSNLLGGVLALLIAIIVGEGPETDGFLAAYSVYLTLILFGSTLRIALVPLLGSTTDEAEFRRSAEDRVRRLLTTAALGVAVVVVASPLLGRAIVPNAPGDAQTTASVSLAVLAFAAYCQIWAAALSAVAGAVRRFMVSALLYVLSAAVAVAVGATLMAIVGIYGAAIGVLLGAGVLLAGHFTYLHRLGFVALPSLPRLRERPSWTLTLSALAGAAIPFALQISLTISLAAVSSRTGAVTAYTYAYFLTVVATGVTASSLNLVTMPDLIVALEREGRSAAHDYMQAVTPFAVFLFLPLAAGYTFLGHAVVEAILGDRLGAGTVDLFWDLSRIFLVMGLGWTVFVAATTIALSQRRYRQLAIVGVAMLAVHATAVVIVSSTGSIAVGIVHACTGSLIIALPLVLVFGRRAVIEAVGAAWVSLPAAGLALVFPSLTALGADDTAAGALGLLVLGAAVYVALGAALWPSVGRRTLQLLLARA